MVRKVLRVFVTVALALPLWIIATGCGGGGGSPGASSADSDGFSATSSAADSNSSSATVANTSSTSSSDTTTTVTISSSGNQVAPGVTATSVGSNSSVTFTRVNDHNVSPTFTFDSATLASLDGRGGTFRSSTSPPVSFLLHLTGSSVGDDGVSFQSVTNPRGKNLDMALQPCVANYCGVLVPRMPAMIGIEGSWSFRLQSAKTSTPGDFKVSVTFRSGPTPGSGTKIIVAPYMLKASKFSTGAIQAALDHLVAIYAKSQITVTVRDMTLVDDSRYLVTNLDFTDPVTQALIARGGTDTVNLFFVDDFSEYGALGIASAIPGSMGVAGGFNGILIGLSPHKKGSLLDTNFLGETSAHEMGHFLGLFHTTEADGVTFDPLDDTPSCSIGRDANRSGSVEVDDCSGSGADNLMFWTPFTGSGSRVTQDTLTNDQQTILRYAPIGQ